MTNPNGLSFISYRRARVGEAALLIGAQHDHGVPTWQDIEDLATEPTEEELERVLGDPNTANVLLWVTPEVEDSRVILTVEVPAMMKRKEADDGFFIVPVAAGSLGYDEAEKIVSAALGLKDFKGWNLEIVTDPIAESDASRIAQVVLRARLNAVDQSLQEGEPFTLGLHSVTAAPKGTGDALQVDWSRHFEGRTASTAAWESILIPALNNVLDAIRHQNPDRGLVAHGQPSLSVALALGSVFVQPCGIRLSWMQTSPGRVERQEWSLVIPKEEAPIQITKAARDVNADQLLVAVGLRGDVEDAIKAGIKDGSIPEGRAAVIVKFKDGHEEFDSPGQVVDAVNRTVTAIREAKSKWQPDGMIHMFLAAPAGFVVMLGQRLNAVGPIQMYEHDDGAGGSGRYHPSVLLRPGR